jgi:hypothetical protein
MTGWQTMRTRLRSRRWTMRRGLPATFALLGALALVVAAAQTPEGGAPGVPATPVPASPDLEIVAASVRYVSEYDILVFEQTVAGTAGATTPVSSGDFDGAPVLGYVVPTTLPAAAIGFGERDGVVALAVTAHPDFDDTPLWDESGDGDYANDGELWHAHWVLLGPDERVGGGLAVQEVAEGDATAVRPPTNADVPLYLDSPGFGVTLEGDTLRVVVPAPRVGDQTDFTYDAATAYLQVNLSDPNRPVLGVYDVYGVLSGDLSLPYTVEAE